MEKDKVLKAIGAIREALGGEGNLDYDHGKGKLIKTLKMKPEWKKRFENLYKMAHEQVKQENKMKTMRNGLWADIEEHYDLYDKHLSYNNESNEIEVYEH